MNMSYREQDIKHETRDYWVLDAGAKGFEVYRTGITHSTRCAQIGHIGQIGLDKAIAECERRQALLSLSPARQTPHYRNWYKTVSNVCGNCS